VSVFLSAVFELPDRCAELLCRQDARVHSTRLVSVIIKLCGNCKQRWLNAVSSREQHTVCRQLPHLRPCKHCVCVCVCVWTVDCVVVGYSNPRTRNCAMGWSPWMKGRISDGNELVSCLFALFSYESPPNITANVRHAWLHLYAIRVLRKNLVWSSDGGDSGSKICG
jgi:hypothetical protein